MANKKDDGTFDFVAFRKQRMEEGTLSSEIDRQRHHKIVKSKHTSSSQAALDDLCLTLDTKEISLGEVFTQYAKSRGYEERIFRDGRQLYVHSFEGNRRYIANHDFLTDKPDICAITLNEEQGIILEARLEGHVLSNSPWPMRLDYQGSQLAKQSSVILGFASLALSVPAYFIMGTEVGVLVGVGGVGTAMASYFIANVAANQRGAKLLPYETISQQVIASDDPQKFFEVVFGELNQTQPKNNPKTI